MYTFFSEQEQSVISIRTDIVSIEIGMKLVNNYGEFSLYIFIIHKQDFYIALIINKVETFLLKAVDLFRKYLISIRYHCYVLM